MQNSECRIQKGRVAGWGAILLLSLMAGGCEAGRQVSMLDSEFPLPTREELEDVTAARFAGVRAAVRGDVPDREALLAELGPRLVALPHARREPSSPGAIDDNSETLSANASRLARGDLLTIRMLLDGLQRDSVRQAILRVIRDDLADKDSEHGGVVRVEGAGERGELVFLPLPPMLGGLDTEYLLSDDGVRQAATSVAVFHLHAHQVDNAEIAGPGVGDLRFAQRMQLNCVVITSLTATSFDVDYYNPFGAVVDVGVYRVVP